MEAAASRERRLIPGLAVAQHAVDRAFEFDDERCLGSACSPARQASFRNPTAVVTIGTNPGRPATRAIHARTAG